MPIVRLSGSLLLAATLLTPATARGVESVEPPGQMNSSAQAINQGDPLVFADSKGQLYHCTAGFVDRENLRVWTAGHCANEAANVFNQKLSYIGQLHHRYSAGKQLPSADDEDMVANYFFHDISYVKLNSADLAGVNSFSGDRSYIPHAGEEICRFGATSATVYCTKIIHVADQLVYAADLNTMTGDSGGPAWTPGKGYVGQAVGVFTFQTDEQEALVMSVIHREDLANAAEQQSRSAGSSHYQPTIEDLQIDARIINMAADAYGKDLPSAAEYSEILRQTEAEISAIKEDIRKLESQLESSNLEKADLQLELDNSQQELLRTIRERDSIAALKLELEADSKTKQRNIETLEQEKQQALDDNAKLKAENRRQLDSHNQAQAKAKTNLAVSIVFAVIALLVAIAGWFGPKVNLPGLGSLPF